MTLKPENFNPQCGTCTFGDRLQVSVSCRHIATGHDALPDSIRYNDASGEYRFPDNACGVEIRGSDGAFALGYWPNRLEQVRLRVRGIFRRSPQIHPDIMDTDARMPVDWLTWFFNKRDI